MILGELMFGTIVAAMVLLQLPFLLIMAGVGVVVLLWLVGTAALLGCLLFWASLSRLLRICDRDDPIGRRLLFLSINTLVVKLADGRKPRGVRRAPRPRHSGGRRTFIDSWTSGPRSALLRPPPHRAEQLGAREHATLPHHHRRAALIIAGPAAKSGRGLAGTRGQHRKN